MIRRLMPSACLVSALCYFAALSYAADCGAIKDMKLPDTTILLAEQVSTGSISAPTEALPIEGLPAFCRVAGVLRPTQDSEIHFEVWMPESDWNGRFLGVGNGGFAGSIGYRDLAGNLRNRYATAGSDTGHIGQGQDASWAFGHPEKAKDFGWRAVHLTAERAKEIVKAYYGIPIKKAYFAACSDGGREALMEAQRFPDDYDGILAGAPSNATTRMFSAQIAEAQATYGNPQAYISALKLPAIEHAALAACDALDGVADGIIGDPTKCHFDPKVLLCKGPDSLNCLTQPQVNSLETYYAGGKDREGRSVFPGLVMGDEAHGWPSWVTGPGPGSGGMLQYATNYFRYMVTDDPAWNILTANVDDSLRLATEKTAADQDATNPDLGRFQARGGKLILYHGWNDPAISPWNSLAYYKSVQRKMGVQKTDSFLRLYMVPGMGHCGGGPGADSFGQSVHPTAIGSKPGLFDALLNWTEEGVPPRHVVATKYGKQADKPRALFTRPLCAYPTVAKYKGTGDTNDATNFICSAE